MTGASGTAKMDSFDGTVAHQYLARVKEVVDYCVDNGMYAIINTHHDEDWEKDTSKIATFEKLWKQIATYFEGYDEHLVFEGMNEVSFSTSDAMTYNQAFVDTVQATGGNNKDRLVDLHRRQQQHRKGTVQQLLHAEGRLQYAGGFRTLL